MSINHGVTILEQATSVKPPVTATAAMPVFFGTAPVHRGGNPAAAVNRPIVCYSFAEAVSVFGYSEDWETWTLCEPMRRQFAAYSVSPAVFINVFDSSKGQATVPAADIPVINGKAVIETELADLATLVVKPESSEPASEIGIDYLANYSASGIDIIILADGDLASAEDISVVYKTVNPALITDSDVIGGVDISTGKRTGVELVDEIFPKTRLVPGILAAPGWSHSIELSQTLTAKARSINSLFKCIAVVDVPESAGPTYRDVPLWKELSGLSSEHCILCWPRATLGERTLHLSTEITGLLGRTDYEMGDIPYASPSNRALQIDGLSWLGNEVSQDQSQANYLNGSGIMTALNWIGGWRAWGNYTCAYPGSTDPKDMWIPVRRMFNWVANSIILSHWQRIDLPIRSVLISDIETSVNLWFDGLTASGAILGGRCWADPSLNNELAIMNGKISFRVYFTPPTPAQEIENILEYDPDYISALFT